MFSGPNSRTFEYLDCNFNNGKSKGHAFHASCLTWYFVTSTSSAIENEPDPYRCPLCNGNVPLSDFPEMRQRSQTRADKKRLENKVKLLEKSLKDSHKFRKDEKKKN